MANTHPQPALQQIRDRKDRNTSRLLSSPEPQKARMMGIREFIRGKIAENDTLTDLEIQKGWNDANPASKIDLGTIKRERTLLGKRNQYDQDSGLADFFSSQAQLMLMQYRNIEELLGPPDSNWSWPGEHCETLLREAIQRHLPPSLVVCKGYIHGAVKQNNEIHRSPEIDILIYNREEFPPLFTMDQFAIVRPDSVVAAIQVKRTLSGDTLAKAVKNVVDAKKHVFETSEFSDFLTIQKMFTAVVSFEDVISQSPPWNLCESYKLSESYRTAILPHISKSEDGDFLPDFIGSLKGVFLQFTKLSSDYMSYQAHASVQNEKNVALPFLLYILVRKIRGFGNQLPRAFPKSMPPIERLTVWEARPAPPALPPPVTSVGRGRASSRAKKTRGS